MMRWILSAIFLIGLALPTVAAAEGGSPPDPEVAASQQMIRKLNAYVELLNRTLRAQESLARYASWVNMKAGPTGRESIIHGLYTLYDVRGEIDRAKAAAKEPPAMPELDTEIPAYIAAYEALAPVVTQADGYYERQDYRTDKMAEGKALHVKLTTAGQAFLAERAKIEPLFAREKSRSDVAELAVIERREGKKARWHLTRVMILARPLVDLLPSDARPVVDLPAFDTALAAYAGAVKEMDEYAALDPNAFSAFEGRPRSWLGKLREFREKLGRARGDARRGAGSDLTWLVNDYNTMVSTAQTATRSTR